MMIKTIIQLNKKYIKKLNQIDVVSYAAQIAYFLLLSIFPLLFFLTTLLGYLPIENNSLLDLLSVFLPTHVILMIDKNLIYLMENQNNSLLSFAILGTLWSSSRGINAITKSLNKIHEVDFKKPYLIDRIIAVGLTLGMIFVIATGLFLSMFGKLLSAYVFNISGDFFNLWYIFSYLFYLFNFFVLFFFFYLFTHQAIYNKIINA